MNDLEICKRIAEIESIEVKEIGGLLINITKVKDCYETLKVATNMTFERFVQSQIESPLIPAHIYNPLTDDALCFRLMVKYAIFMTPIPAMEMWSARVWYEGVKPYGAKDKSPNRAICLAIIEAHND